MSAQGFRPIYMAGAVAAAALSCYLVSLNVGMRRSAVEKAEQRILDARADIRALETEIGTRGRLAQLEKWNASVIRLSAPQADQFVGDGFQLAALARPHRPSAMEAPVVLAAAPAPPPARSVPVADSGDEAPATATLLRVASYTPTRDVRRVTPDGRAATPPAATSAPAARAETKTAAVAPRPAKPETAKGAGKVAGKAAGKAASGSARLAASDPLAPLPGAAQRAKGPGPSTRTTGSH